jgi:cytochrome oxidase Cu insertion factor (SCO1/SenC/PrrC family)
MVRNNRLKLLAIIALFMLPPLAAWVAWQTMDATGAGATTNAGTLVTPARPLSFAGLKQPDGNVLDESALRGRWTIVMFANGECDDRCSELLYLTRQIRLGMNKDIPRVQRLLVLDTSPSPEVAAELARDHEDLIWVIRDASAATLMQAFHGDGFAPDGEQSFLVDPLGNLMMVYGPEVPAKGMMKDLRKLLKISQIG